jgi:O-acetylserine/cysteine efflux transporter
VRPRHIALALFIAVVWGVNFVVIRVGLDSMSPLLFCAVRFTVAAVPAVFFVGRPTVAWRWIILTALTLGVAQYALLFAGIAAGMPAGLSALVLQVQAIFTIAFATLALRDRPGRRALAGVAVSAAGVAVIAADLGLSRPVGAFLPVIAAGAAWGVGNVAMRRAAPAGTLNFMVWVSAAAVVPLVAMTLVVDGPAYVGKTLRGLDLTALGAIGYIAWISTLVGFGLWGRLINRYGASTVAPFAALAPVVAIAATALLLDERVTIFDAVGGALVLAGLLLGSIRRARRPVRVPEREPAAAPRTTAGRAG